jgi:hypothetical protein
MNKFQKWMGSNGDNQKNVMQNFYEVAGKLIDTQIQWTPEQQGRFDVVLLPDNKTPVVEFHQFPEGTMLRLKHPLAGSVTLGLKAAAAAISYVAMNRVIWAAHEAGKTEASQVADGYWNAIGKYIFHTRTFGKDEQLCIRRYAD